MVLKSITYSEHAIQQMFKRNISVLIVEETILTGKVIKEYPNDKPYPSILILHFINNRPIHVVLAINNESGIVVTAYEPDPIIWENGFETKK